MSLLESYRMVSPNPRLNGARYTPFASGVFRMEVGMKPLGADFGFPGVDKHVFQFDANFSVYRKAKRLARNENPSKYFQTHNFDSITEGGIAEFIAQHAAAEPRFRT